MCFYTTPRDLYISPSANKTLFYCGELLRSHLVNDDEIVIDFYSRCWLFFVSQLLKLLQTNEFFETRKRRREVDQL